MEKRLRAAVEEKKKDGKRYANMRMTSLLREEKEDGVGGGRVGWGCVCVWKDCSHVSEVK